MAETSPIKLKVDFWDVGQGDCSVIHLPNGELFIIDVGPPRSALVEWLHERPDLSINTIVITHNDEDHVGCLDDLLERYHTRIDRLVMMIDRDTEKIKELLQIVKSYHTKGKIKLSRLEVDEQPKHLYWNDDGSILISAVHPDFGDAIDNLARKGPKPNEVSGIICLDIHDERQVIWPGDASMQTLTEVCTDDEPLMLVGPHHGAPIKRDAASYEGCFDKIQPSEVFVSVGTKGGHNHPDKSFVKRHVKRGRRVCCSQLVHCDAARKKQKQHVLNNHLLLGMSPPLDTNAVTCRGPMQLTWDSSYNEFMFDRFHNQHLAKLKDGTVENPLCFSGSILEPS